VARSKWPMVRDKLILVEKWCRDGLSEAQIAKNLGVAMSTFSEYKNKYPELMDALKKGKEVFITEIENALSKSATGFYYEEEKTYIRYEDDKEVRYKEVAKKYQPPNVAACSLLLKNKDKDDKGKTKWSDNPGKLDLDKEVAAFNQEMERKKIW